MNARTSSRPRNAITAIIRVTSVRRASLVLRQIPHMPRPTNEEPPATLAGQMFAAATELPRRTPQQPAQGKADLCERARPYVTSSLPVPGLMSEGDRLIYVDDVVGGFLAAAVTPAFA